MKTLKLQRDTAGKFDIIVTQNKWTALDTDKNSDLQLATEQRIIKALLAQQNIFDEDFGVGIKQYIGKKKIYFDIDKKLRALQSFYQRTKNDSGDMVITNLVYTINDNQVFITAQTEKGQQARLKFVEDTNK